MGLDGRLLKVVYLGWCCCCYWRRNFGRWGIVRWGGYCWMIFNSRWRMVLSGGNCCCWRIVIRRLMIGLIGESYWFLMGVAGWGGYCWMIWISSRMGLGGRSYCCRIGFVWCSGYWWRARGRSCSCFGSNNCFFSFDCLFRFIWR